MFKEIADLPGLAINEMKVVKGMAKLSKNQYLIG
jgi:hypothetical protein